MKELYHITKDGEKCVGPHEKLNLLEETEIYGDCTEIYGDLSCDLVGDCTFVSGDITGAWGDCTGLHLTLDAYNFTYEERFDGIYVENLWGGSDYGLDYNDEQDSPKYVTITKIVVPSERDKEQLLKAFKYLHDCDIDTDYYAVNTIVHVYENPDLIEVQQ